MQSNETTTDPLAGRNEQLKSLFTIIYPKLAQSVYERHPQMQAPFHGELMSRLVALLPTYSGPVTETDLLAWVELQERSDPGTFLLCLHADCRPFVHRAIWSALGHSEQPSFHDDYPETVKELATDTWVWAMENVAKLMEPGRAKLSTRLYARARIITRAWVKKQRTRRAALIRKVFDLPSKASAHG